MKASKEGESPEEVKRLRIDFLNSQMTQPYPLIDVLLLCFALLCFALLCYFSFSLFCVLNERVREKVLNSFRSGKTQFLITTDVVNRGIDIPNLNYVLNYDFPTNLVTYISNSPLRSSLNSCTCIESAARVETTRRGTLAASLRETCRR